jgi:hypothetical protein
MLVFSAGREKFGSYSAGVSVGGSHAPVVKSMRSGSCQVK